MTTIDLTTARPTPARRLAAMVCDHNPFYLLSGVCLLAGGFAISLAAHETVGEVALLTMLLTVFHIYELLIIGLAVYLVRSRDLLRDAGYLLVLETLLLVDVTLLHHELFTASGAAGSAVAAIAVALGLVKVALIARGLGVMMGWREWTAVTVGLVGVYGLPGLLRWLKWLEVLDPGWFMVVWWLVAVVVVAAALPRAHVEQVDRFGAMLRRVLVWVPAGSVVWHVGLAHWQYEVAWSLAMAGPVLAALAAGMALGWGDAATPRTARRWSLALGAAAIASTLGAGPADAAWLDWATPMRITTLAVAAAWVLTGLRRGGRGPWSGAAVAVGIVLLGPTPTGIAATLRMTWDAVTTGTQRLLPRDTLTWGLLGVAAAFVLLAVGAVASLLGRRPAG